MAGSVLCSLLLSCRGKNGLTTKRVTFLRFCDTGLLFFSYNMWQWGKFTPGATPVNFNIATAGLELAQHALKFKKKSGNSVEYFMKLKSFDVDESTETSVMTCGGSSSLKPFCF